MFRSRAQWGNVFLRGGKAPVLRRLFPACGGLVSSHGVPILYSCVPVPLVIDWFRLMGRIDEDSIRRVLEATDIVDVVGSYLPLKRAGSRWKACCPFHNEKTPSFIVDQSRQNFKCFGCGEGGSAITFVMKMENLGFADTVRRLAEKAGISIVEEVYDAAEERRRKARTALLVSLPQPERDALGMLNLEPIPIPDVDRSVQEACSGIAKAALERHIASLMAELADPSTDAARRLELSKLSVDLKRLLGTM